jgi:hypothetical protein
MAWKLPEFSKLQPLVDALKEAAKVIELDAEEKAKGLHAVLTEQIKMNEEKKLREESNVVED